MCALVVGDVSQKMQALATRYLAGQLTITELVLWIEDGEGKTVSTSGGGVGFVGAARAGVDGPAPAAAHVAARLFLGHADPR
jgi:hypothetical protein